MTDIIIDRIQPRFPDLEARVPRTTPNLRLAEDPRVARLLAAGWHCAGPAGHCAMMRPPQPVFTEAKMASLLEAAGV
jgi:hypothetical protein